MALYDEDVMKMLFIWQFKRGVLIFAAKLLKSIVLVPCKGSLSRSTQSTCQFDSSFLKPVGESFQTLNGKETFIQGNRIKGGKNLQFHQIPLP
uniref:Uncharacterized protein n=1 Tax=Vombatus ursinus TaxID=29139 RepID=A0A4X2LM08_VOMUR